MLVSDAGARAHRRQFVIARQPFLPEEDWTSQAISNEFHLSRQRDLPVQVLEQDGRRVLLLGQAVALTPGAGPDELAGRFVRIEWPYLHPDPSALLPVYYGDTPDGPLVTSSPGLAARLTRFECVTQSFDGVKPADIEIAGRISRHLGLRHHVVGPEAFDEAPLRLWREHALDSYRDADDVHLIPQNQYRFLGAGDLLVRGGCFEFGRRFYASRFTGLDFGNATGATLWSRFESAAPHLPTVAALDAWLDWRRGHADGLDLVDSFYLDQRAGDWLASVEHGLDMLPGPTLPAANCSRILSALITPNEAERADGRLQRDVIRLLEPGLLRFPVNPLGLGERAVRLLHRTRDGIKRRIKRALPEAMVRRLRK